MQKPQKYKGEEDEEEKVKMETLKGSVQPAGKEKKKRKKKESTSSKQTAVREDDEDRDGAREPRKKRKEDQAELEKTATGFKQKIKGKVARPGSSASSYESDTMRSDLSKEAENKNKSQSSVPARNEGRTEVRSPKETEATGLDLATLGKSLRGVELQRRWTHGRWEHGK